MYNNYIIIFFLVASSFLKCMESHYSLCPESGILGSQPPAPYVPYNFKLFDKKGTEYDAQRLLIDCPFLECKYWGCCNDLEEHIATSHVQLKCLICEALENSLYVPIFFSLKDFFDHTHQHTQKELDPHLVRLRYCLLEGTKTVMNFLKYNYHFLKSNWISMLLECPEEMQDTRI